VALIAARPEVGAIQHKGGMAGVIELAEAPVAGVVAAFAIHSQRAFVGIVAGMAAIAGVLGIAVQRGGMALVASHHAMRAQQHECDLVVVEVRGLPCRFVVTRGAGVAQLALVRIVLAMTARAIRGQFLGVDVAGVAGLALGVAMGATQWEFRLGVVIETVALPVVAAMAIAARFAIAALVGVILAMAADALAAAVAEMFGIGMAAATLRRSVLAGQHEFRARMVETRRRLPTLRPMAALACGAERVAMAIVLAMAADTGLGCALEVVGIGMASAALGVGVATEQRIAGAAMIEARGLPIAVDVALPTVVA